MSNRNVMRCDFYFELPEGFNGTRGDALRELAKYDDEHEDTPVSDRHKRPEESCLWDVFLGRGEGRRFVGQMGQQVYNGVVWTTLGRDGRPE